MIISAISSIVSNALPTVNAQVIFKSCPPETCDINHTFWINVVLFVIGSVCRIPSFLLTIVFIKLRYDAFKNYTK